MYQLACSNRREVKIIDNKYKLIYENGKLLGIYDIERNRWFITRYDYLELQQVENHIFIRDNTRLCVAKEHKTKRIFDFTTYCWFESAYENDIIYANLQIEVVAGKVFIDDTSRRIYDFDTQEWYATEYRWVKLTEVEGRVFIEDRDSITSTERIYDFVTGMWHQKRYDILKVMVKDNKLCICDCNCSGSKEQYVWLWHQAPSLWGSLMFINYINMGLLYYLFDI